MSTFPNQQKAQTTLPFGRHKGEAIVSVPEDYLSWLAYATKENGTVFIVKNGVNWSYKAEFELYRRGSSFFKDKWGSKDETGQTHLPVESEPEPEFVPSEKAEPYNPKIKQGDKISILPSAVDDAVELLLKEFLLRTDKAIRFNDWLGDFLREAALHGTFTGHDTANDLGTYSYLKKKFVYYTRKKALFRIIQE